MIAKAYLAASDPALTSRTWQAVLSAIIDTKTDDTRHRWETAAKDRAFDLLRNLPLVKTQAEDIFKAINSGTVSTNVYLRRMHNFAWDMGWLLAPVVVRRHWPKIRFREKRAITLEEHKRIIEREGNPERRSYYEMCWHLGGAQGDVACLQAEDIDWAAKSISYERRKLKGRGLRRRWFGSVPTWRRSWLRCPARGPCSPTSRPSGRTTAQPSSDSGAANSVSSASRYTRIGMRGPNAPADADSRSDSRCSPWGTTAKRSTMATPARHS
jgi:hypothetical protein